MTSEQRHFTRIPFNASVLVIHCRTGRKYIADLIDISFKGVLISTPSDWQGINDDQYTVHLELAGHEVEINLAVVAVHKENEHVGFKIAHMDIDSATNLRRLVELNLADETLLERELSELCKTS